MNANVQNFNYNGNCIAFSLENDVMINATQMAKPFNKRPNDYLSLPSTTALVEAITRKYGNSDYQIVATKPGSPENGGGTWMHKIVALDFAQWLSVDLKLWCTERLDELIRYGITTTQPTIEYIISNPETGIKLLQALQEERREKQMFEQQNTLLTNEIKQSAPKIQYVNNVLQSINTYTSTQMAKELGMREAEQLHKVLKEKGIIFKQSGQWMITAKYCENGYTKSRTTTYTRSDGSQGTNTITVWTEKGRAFLHNQIMAN